MALYKYIAASAGEPAHEMLVEADSERLAREKLRARGCIPVRFCGEAPPDTGSLFRRRRGADTYEFTRQLAPLLDSFIPLERALGIIAESAAEKTQRDFVNSLRQGLHEGKKFSEIVRSYGTLFPNYYANMIESGEESGCLPEVVRELHKFMGESRELRDFIISSSIYPLAILTVTVLVSILLFTVFVPRFAHIFSDMGREQPPSMRFLLTVSAIASYAWWAVPLAGYGLWKLLRFRLGAYRLRYETSRLLLGLPLLGKIVRDLEMCKYIRTLAILIANHVEIIRTVRIAGRIISNPVIAESFSAVDRKLKEGDKLSAALAGNPWLPSGTAAMLRVGEESGGVGTMLERIAAHLETDTKLKIKRLLSLFEPAVIIFLALMVLIVVVSIFVAMMEINSITQGGPGI